jgi:Xaa-Pro dipeptidase
VPLNRTFSLGEPSAELSRLADATGEGLNAMLDVIRAGVPVREVAAVWNRTIFEYGYEKDSRLGYSIGVGYPPDWGERTISIRSEEESVLAENMTFHLICGMWMDNYGYGLSESIRVTATGVETFTTYKRGLLPINS